MQVAIPTEALKNIIFEVCSLLQLCAREWQLEARAPVQGLALAMASPRRLGLPRYGSTSPLIYVSNLAEEIGLWDIETARCHQVTFWL